VHRLGIQQHFVQHLDERDLAALAHALEKVRDHVRPLRLTLEFSAALSSAARAGC
jgi:hypothetical protein